MPREQCGLTYKKLLRRTATDLSILYRPIGQRGEFSNLRNAPVEFFMVTVINDECGNELLNSASVVPTDKKRKRTNWETNRERCSFDAFYVLLRQDFPVHQHEILFHCSFQFQFSRRRHHGYCSSSEELPFTICRAVFLGYIVPEGQKYPPKDR